MEAKTMTALIQIEHVSKFLELPLIYRGLSRKQREPLVLQALEVVDLLDRRMHFPSELSGGQQ
ncbi:hypothetical protein [Paenibacillus oryzisoli]|uniref:hypothetical protein n=1 Tax=Paenibacillus oryzisoli TaxID=1850517 RepID=UPI00195B17FA